MQLSRRAIALLLFIALSSASGDRVLAQVAVTAPGAARADALFNEGKAKLTAERYAEACPLLAESFAIDPATGTLLAMALCHERAGDPKTAIKEYREAASRSKQEGRADREQAASKRADELEAMLAEPTTAAAAAPPATVEREPRPVRNREPEPAPASSGGISTGQWIGIATASAGVVAFGVSAGFAVHASSLESDSEANCDGDLCTARGRQTRLDARSAGDLATAMALSGAVLLTTGAAIFFSSGPEPESDYALAPWVAPHAAGATATGRF